jgi:biopolymer transport protein ExbD
MAKREIQEINAGSMADIAFLLLIFFLVTTTMDTDSGILTKLPPMPEEQQDDVQIKERNIFVVLVNRDNQLLVEGELMDLKDLREATKEFIVNPNNDPNLPVKKVREFPYIGTMEVTPNHVISLRNDRGTSYETYITVQNEIEAAYAELKDELSMRYWGKKYKDLETEYRDVVDEVYGKKLSEAEPNNIGG